MSRLIIIESGSTKTTVLSTDLSHNEVGYPDNVQEKQLAGYNPNRKGADFTAQLTTIEINPNDRVFFYGSGLGNAVNKEHLKRLFQDLVNVPPVINDDILGAGRALCGDKAGIIGILGTGGVVAYYDGCHITQRKGGYGYLIDDIGGGYELGKVLVSAWLNKSLPNEMSQRFTAHFGTEPSNFISHYYQSLHATNPQQSLKAIAETTIYAAEFSSNAEVAELLKRYFETFFERHVMPIAAQTNQQEIRLLGSIASVFKDQIRQVAAEQGLSVSYIIQYPANNLLNYHWKEMMK